ncbi:MAG: hypothetical protein AB2A00_26090 [Myxococcota bacterium]
MSFPHTLRRHFLIPAALLLATPVAHAAKVEVHSVTGFEKLAEGEPRGTAVASHGAVVLAPTANTVAELSGGPVLAVVHDGKGTTYAALATPGRVVAVDAQGKTRTLLETEEPVVSALALDGKDGLFVATAPEGKVLRVDLKTGKSVTWWKPAEKYLWGMAWDGSALHVVTGDSGALYKVTAQNQAQRVAEKPLTEKALRSVAVLPGGKGVVVGGGRKGILWTVDAKGVPFALYDSSLEEVTSVAVRADGAIAASLVANEAKGGGDDELLAASEAGAEVDDTIPRDTKASEVVVIMPNGEMRRIWRGKKDGAYAVAFDERDGVLIGTGGRGRLYRVELESRRIALVAQVDSSRVTSMARGPGGVVLGLSHASRVALVTNAPAREGTYLSTVMDSEKTVRFGRLDARAEVPAGSKVTLQLRTGNTEEPDETWSAWSASVPSSGGAVTVPRARFAQVKATLTSDGRAAPELRELHLAYAADNAPPQVQTVDVLAPGVRVEAMPSDEPKGRTFTVSSRAFEDFELKPLQSPAPPEPAARAKQTYEAGWRTVAWHATDEDEDEMRYTAELMTDGGQRVLTLGQELRDPFISFDESRLPDGVYRVRIRATDAPGNPAGAGKSSEKVSASFAIDRTAPGITTRLEGKARVLLTVEDQSPVIRLWCSVDGGEALQATPNDGLWDAPREEASLALPSLQKGRHFVACRAEDAMGNVGRTVAPVDVP